MQESLLDLVVKRLKDRIWDCLCGAAYNEDGMRVHDDACSKCHEDYAFLKEHKLV